MKTFAIIGSAPSLTQGEIDYLYGKSRVIAINDNYLRCPWAEILYFCDSQWYNWHKDRKELQQFEGKIATISEIAVDWNFQKGRISGLTNNKRKLNTGKNSAHQCVNLAKHLGADKILLLGVDMRPSGHWFGTHPIRTPDAIYDKMLPYWDTIKGVNVINCSDTSAIQCFPKMSVYDAI